MRKLLPAAALATAIVVAPALLDQVLTSGTQWLAIPLVPGFYVVRVLDHIGAIEAFDSSGDLTLPGGIVMYLASFLVWFAVVLAVLSLIRRGYHRRVKTVLLTLLLAPALFAQLSPRPADATLPVVGSTRGQANANFKTELQLSNPSESVIAGWLFLRPHGAVHRYELPPHTTISFADVVADLGATGLGSLDILVERGRIPTIIARAYDDQPAGTTGATIPLVRADAILSRNDFASLVAPRDLTRYRFNAGVRAMDNGATLEIVVRASDGSERHRRLAEYAAHHFEQQSGNAFAGITLNADDAIEVVVRAGSAIVYGSTVDNATNDSSVQILTR